MAAPSSRHDLMQCPFNREHLISAGRFQHHLMKCRRNYAGDDLATCSFNATHIVPKAELSMHLANCPSREVLDQDLYNKIRIINGQMRTGDLSVPVFEHHTPEHDENWDEEDALVLHQNHGSVRQAPVIQDPGKRGDNAMIPSGRSVDASLPTHVHNSRHEFHTSDMHQTADIAGSDSDRESIVSEKSSCSSNVGLGRMKYINSQMPCRVPKTQPQIFSIATSKLKKEINDTDTSPGEPEISSSVVCDQDSEFCPNPDKRNVVSQPDQGRGRGLLRYTSGGRGLLSSGRNRTAALKPGIGRGLVSSGVGRGIYFGRI